MNVYFYGENDDGEDCEWDTDGEVEEANAADDMTKAMEEVAARGGDRIDVIITTLKSIVMTLSSMDKRLNAIDAGLSALGDEEGHAHAQGEADAL